MWSLARKPRPVAEERGGGVEVGGADDGVAELARPDRAGAQDPGAREPVRSARPGPLQGVAGTAGRLSLGGDFEHRADRGGPFVSRGLVTVRPGPGGGIFAAEQSPMVRLGNSVLALDAQETDVADAVRIRDALDPPLIEDALWHASPADIASLRRHIEAMAEAVTKADPVAFVHADWKLHTRIAAISPNPPLRSLYKNLLDLIESHTPAVLPASEQPLAEYIAERHELHRDLVDAVDARDREKALRLIHAHNTSLTDAG
ncbi:FCD domain-containing protein [Streptomyces sp. SID8379]|nr:FCD domain-containing protein [Streptomyces sp. SID8379]